MLLELNESGGAATFQNVVWLKIESPKEMETTNLSRRRR